MTFTSQPSPFLAPSGESYVAQFKHLSKQSLAHRNDPKDMGGGALKAGIMPKKPTCSCCRALSHFPCGTIDIKATLNGHFWPEFLRVTRYQIKRIG